MSYQNNIEYEERLVAFLDILGFKSLINQNKADSIETIKVVNKEIQYTLKIISEENNTDDDISLKLFSDCFCVSSNDILIILKKLSYIQFYLSMKGIFLRGALSKGLHYENENIIFSKGLINAYELEQTARYPRIIVSKSLLKEYEKIIIEGCILTAPDDIPFIHYLNQKPYYEDVPIENELLEDHKKSIIQQVEKNVTIPNIIEKYRWAAEYHNYTVESLMNPEDLEEDYYKDTMAELLVPMNIFPGFSECTSRDRSGFGI